jgi:type II secretory pathway component PulM
MPSLGVILVNAIFYQVFYFIKPTSANLAAYERWSGTELQTHAWLGDMVDEVVKVELTAGNTMIIPTGWIHAVVRPTFCSLQLQFLMPVRHLVYA